MSKIFDFIGKKKTRDLKYFLTEAPSNEKKRIYTKAIISAKEQQNVILKKYDDLVNSGVVMPIKQRQHTSVA